MMYSLDWTSVHPSPNIHSASTVNIIGNAASKIDSCQYGNLVSFMSDNLEAKGKTMRRDSIFIREDLFYILTIYSVD